MNPFKEGQKPRGWYAHKLREQMSGMLVEEVRQIVGTEMVNPASVRTQVHQQAGQLGFAVNTKVDQAGGLWVKRVK